MKCLLAGDNVTALFLLRNELSKFPKFFLDEKKQLSQLFLLESKKDLVRESGLDVNNRFFLEEFLKELEQREGGEELGGSAPFEDWVKRYLAYELLSCPFHRPGSHNLLSPTFKKQAKQSCKDLCKKSNETNGEEGRGATGKTKKIAKKETADPTKRRKRRRKRHACKPRTFNLETKHELKNSKDEIWRLKFSGDCKFIVAATKARSLYCWKQG